MARSISQEAWEGWPALRLASAAVALVVVPDLGARVVSIQDLRSGREWLTQGQLHASEEVHDRRAEAAEFDGSASFGWDECLPTVAPCADPRDSAAQALRDHGDQWGRPTSTIADEWAGALVTSFPGARWGYDFSRRLSLVDESTVLAEYSVHNPSDRAMPLLWSMHPCLRLEAGSRLELPGVEAARVTWAGGIDLAQGQVSFPMASRSNSGQGLDLSLVRTGEGWAAKLYAEANRPVRAVTPSGASLSFEWDHEFAPALGIWLAYGGWPQNEAPVEQVALEPTTSGHDDLASAMRAGKARRLEPGGRVEWWVRLGLAP